jgi:hypothetical protein
VLAAAGVRARCGAEELHDPFAQPSRFSDPHPLSLQGICWAMTSRPQRTSRAAPTFCDVCKDYHPRGDARQCDSIQRRAKVDELRAAEKRQRAEEREQAGRAAAQAQSQFVGMFLPRLQPSVLHIDTPAEGAGGVPCLATSEGLASHQAGDVGVEDGSGLYWFDDEFVPGESVSVEGALGGGGGGGSGCGGVGESAPQAAMASAGVPSAIGCPTAPTLSHTPFPIPSWVCPGIEVSSGVPESLACVDADSNPHTERCRKMVERLMAWVPDEKWADLGLATLHCIDSFPSSVRGQPLVGCKSSVCKELRVFLEAQYEGRSLIYRSTGDAGFRYTDVRGAPIDFTTALLASDVELVTESLRRGMSKDDLRFMSARDRFRPSSRPAIDRKVFMVSSVAGGGVGPTPGLCSPVLVLPGSL